MIYVNTVISKYVVQNEIINNYITLVGKYKRDEHDHQNKQRKNRAVSTVRTCERYRHKSLNDLSLIFRLIFHVVTTVFFHLTVEHFTHHS